MPTLAQNQYLTTEVMTATPQRLQLLLIEGVIRLVERARQCWQNGDTAGASENLTRAQRIMVEMATGVRTDKAPKLTRKVAAVYWFIYRRLVEANMQHEEAKLDDALRVLRVEQETWRLVCEQLGSSDAAAQAGSVSLSEQETDFPDQTPPPPTERPSTGFSAWDVSSTPVGGFSFEA